MKTMNPEEYGAACDPPRSARRITELCRAKRIVGARKRKGEWVIPEGAEILGVGLRGVKQGKQLEGLSVTEYARKHGKSRQRVDQLLKMGRIDGATRTQHGWDIPEDAPWPADNYAIGFAPPAPEPRVVTDPGVQPERKMPGSVSIRR